MIGDRRKYPALLIVPAMDQVESWAREKGIDPSDHEELVARPEVVEFLEDQALGPLDDLARYERPKKIAVVPHEFTVEGGELTPSLKVKRRVVQEKYRDLIDALYEDEEAADGP